MQEKGDLDAKLRAAQVALEEKSKKDIATGSSLSSLMEQITELKATNEELTERVKELE